MKIFLFLFSFLILNLSVYSQTDNIKELSGILKEKDSLLFNIGYNTCDISQFENLLSDDFEFYHDQIGIIKSKSEFISSIKKNICGLQYKPKRVLIEKSVEVFPLMKNGTVYGAIQNGKHNFYAIENDSTEYITSVAKFSNVWLVENGNWKLSRSYSFDHKDFDKPSENKLLFTDKTETEKWLKEKHIPALGIGYIKDGRIVQTSVFGELEKGKSAPENTIWNVASLTKPITAMVTLKLINSGKLTLDEPLYKYYTDPDIAEDPRAKKLTIRMILSHKTGFPNWRRESKDGKLAFEYEPGTHYGYSGEGYEYLRKALESKFGKPLEKMADELIFSPLKMNDTQFFHDSKTDENRFAKWHNDKGVLYKTYKNTSTNAADDLLTTVGDYCKFLVHVLNVAGLSQNLYNEMISEQTRINDYKYFGLCWYVDENINTNKDFAIAHGGDDIGVHTIVFMLPKTNEGLLIFTNSDNGTNAFIDVILKYLGENGQGIIDDEMK